MTAEYNTGKVSDWATKSASLGYDFGSRSEAQKKRDRQSYTDYKKTVRVSNLVDGIEEDDLKGLFGKFGKVRSVRIPRTKERGEWIDQGFALVTFTNEEDAQTSVDQCNNTLWMHTRIRVSISRPPKLTQPAYTK